VWQTVTFWVLAGVAVAAGVAVFRVASMARATYALAVSFVAVGLALVVVGLDYLGIVTVLMMVMEMAVMAVYMVMFMMNPGGLMPMSMVHSPRGAAGLAAGTFVMLSAAAVGVPWPDRSRAVSGDATAALGGAIMGSQMLVMMLVGALLFATIVATVVLAARATRYDRLGRDLRAARRAGPSARNARGPHDPRVDGAAGQVTS